MLSQYVASYNLDNADDTVGPSSTIAISDASRIEMNKFFTHSSEYYAQLPPPMSTD